MGQDWSHATRSDFDEQRCANLCNRFIEDSEPCVEGIPNLNMQWTCIVHYFPWETFWITCKQGEFARHKGANRLGRFAELPALTRLFAGAICVLVMIFLLAYINILKRWERDQASRDFSAGRPRESRLVYTPSSRRPRSIRHSLSCCYMDGAADPATSSSKWHHTMQKPSNYVTKGR